MSPLVFAVGSCICFVAGTLIANSKNAHLEVKRFFKWILWILGAILATKIALA